MEDITQAEQAERFIRVGEAARILQVTEVTVRDWADRGLIPYHRTPAGQRRFLRSELEVVLRNGSAA